MFRRTHLIQRAAEHISTTMGYMHLGPKTVDLAVKLLETDPTGNLTATQQEAEEG